MAEPTTIQRAREQGYREGYARALADMQLHLSGAIDVAYEQPSPGPYVAALHHARAIVRGLRGRAARRANHG